MPTASDRWERQSGDWLRLRDHTTVSTATQKYVWGAACGPSTLAIADSLPEFNRVNALLGGDWTIRRSYQPGTETAAPAEPTGVLGFRSMHPNLTQLAAGSLDSLIASWIGSMPNGAYATIWHEMDAPPKGITPAVFDAGFNRFAQVAKATKPGVKVGPVAMEFQIRTQGVNNYQYCRTLNPANIDFWGFDTYDGFDTPMVGFATSCTRAAIPFFSGLDSSKPYVSAETGAPLVVKSTSSYGGGYTAGQALNIDAYLLDSLQWSASHNMTLLYYNVGSDYKITDAQTTALAAQLP